MALTQGNRISTSGSTLSKTRRHRKGKAGFALVATMVMLPLLAILVVGLLTLSSVSLRTESRVLPMKRAQANARVALMLALGEMQKNLGPDQRVSGDARIGSRSSSEPANPHWVSVWKTTRDDEKPWIVRESENGGLRDVRQDGAWDPRRERLAVLVSGNEGRILHDDDKELDEKASVTLVGKGSLGKDGEETDQVKAPLVSISKDGKSQGGYAWWVGDLGARANIATADGAEETKDKNHPVMLAQDASWQAFGNNEIPGDSRSGLVSEQQIGLFDRDYRGKNYHDVTVWSEGLPVDVREGGWKKDLTAFIESDGNVRGRDGFSGLDDQDRLVGPANEAADRESGFPGQAERFSQVSPRFGLIRKWARRADSLAPGVFTATSELGDSINYPTGGGNLHSVDIYKRTTSHVMPVLVEGSMYYNLSYYSLAKPTTANPYGLRVHFYPRVVLWNPYNFRLRVPDSAIFMHINGAKFVEVTLTNNQKRTYRMFWGTSNDKITGGSARGGMYFKMTGATIEPGESLVWSPTRNTPYNESAYAQNLLSTSFAPSPSRSLYMDSRGDGSALFKATQTTYPGIPGFLDNVLQGPPSGWREVVPAAKTNNLQQEAYTQADDYFMSWKPFSPSSLTADSFKDQPMGRFVSCAYQLGDEDEMPVEWTSTDPVPMPLSSIGNPAVNQIPDRRTRDGFRMRWLQEPPSNVIGSGSLAGRPHLEESAVGNWNLRASWAFRTPFENVTDVAPNFFGIYTRDLFDGDVDWTSMNPRVSGGTIGGDPFDQPVRSPGPRILFDSPRKGSEVISLGALQHVNFSEFIWHPTYALGNSMADPRVPMANTEPPRSNRMNKDKGGWNQDTMGYSTDGRSGNDNGLTTDADNWAWHARNMLKPVTTTESNIQTALTQTLVYDLSYELNHS
ncbi:MAG TPA: hypothetical protein VM511_09290, partial [Luteolibacter sp.]|nr:hypothetical protein [Luteolibacter sp.]